MSLAVLLALAVLVICLRHRLAQAVLNQLEAQLHHPIAAQSMHLGWGTVRLQNIVISGEPDFPGLRLAAEDSRVRFHLDPFLSRRERVRTLKMNRITLTGPGLNVIGLSLRLSGLDESEKHGQWVTDRIQTPYIESASAAADWTWQGEPDLQRMNGWAKIEFDQGRFPQFTPAVLFPGMTADHWKSLGLQDISSLPFDTLRVEARLTQGQLLIDQAQLSGPVVKAEAGGSISIPRGDLNVPVHVATGDGQTEADLRLSGAWSRPAVQVVSLHKIKVKLTVP